MACQVPPPCMAVTIVSLSADSPLAETLEAKRNIQLFFSLGNAAIIPQHYWREQRLHSIRKTD